MRAIVIAAVVAIAAIGIYYVIEDANKGPLEKAAESVEDAAEDIADEIN